MVRSPVLGVFLDWGTRRRWWGWRQWAEMGGLLSLACLAICPGVKVCTHRGCTPPPTYTHTPAHTRLGQGVPPPDWQRAEAPVSQSFSSGWLPPPPPARDSLPSTQLPSPPLCTPRHTGSSVTVRSTCGRGGVRGGGWWDWGCQGRVGLVQTSGALPSLQRGAEGTEFV